MSIVFGSPEAAEIRKRDRALFGDGGPAVERDLLAELRGVEDEIADLELDLLDLEGQAAEIRTLLGRVERRDERGEDDGGREGGSIFQREVTGRG